MTKIVKDETHIPTLHNANRRKGASTHALMTGGATKLDVRGKSAAGGRKSRKAVGR